MLSAKYYDWFSRTASCRLHFVVLPGEDLLARLCSSQGSPDLQRGALGEGHSKALSYTHTAGPAPELASLLWKGIRLYSFIKTLVQPGPSNLGLDLVFVAFASRFLYGWRGIFPIAPALSRLFLWSSAG